MGNIQYRQKGIWLLPVLLPALRSSVPQYPEPSLTKQEDFVNALKATAEKRQTGRPPAPYNTYLGEPRKPGEKRQKARIVTLRNLPAEKITSPPASPRPTLPPSTQLLLKKACQMAEDVNKKMAEQMIEMDKDREEWHKELQGSMEKDIEEKDKDLQESKEKSIEVCRNPRCPHLEELKQKIKKLEKEAKEYTEEREQAKQERAEISRKVEEMQKELSSLNHHRETESASSSFLLTSYAVLLGVVGFSLLMVAE